MGRQAHYLADEQEAMGAIAGFCVANDVSERSFQLERGGQWSKGKSSPTFNPLGPWLVTADEIADVQDLALGLEVNGEVMQSGSTSRMIFGVANIVHYLSQFIRLEPGDVINTGTEAAPLPQGWRRRRGLGRGTGTSALHRRGPALSPSETPIRSPMT